MIKCAAPGSRGVVHALVLVILTCVIPGGCARGMQIHAMAPAALDRRIAPAKAESNAGAAPADMAARSDEVAPAAPPLPDATPPQTGEKRIVIYTATLTIVVPEIEAALKQVESLTNACGGWVHEIRGDRITIRVPAAKFTATESQVEALGRVTNRQLEAADVTAEFVDLEARLRNALAVRERLAALLARAETVQAALEVEKELKRVGEEIERLQAQLKLLKNRVAYSTITIAFERVYRTAPTPQLMKLPFEWLHELDPKRLTAEY
jgi:hypothetical protein